MSVDEFQPGEIVNGRYEVIDIVGQGGMGTVVKAQRQEDGEIVAIKYCHLSDDDSLSRFRREVRIMKDINHPNVISILKTGLKHDPPYFVMPFAESSCGAKLADYASNEDQALGAFLQLCEGVRAIHSADAVHRDIKPDNALILNGQVVLSDLGLAKFNNRDTTILTQTIAIVGTDMYLAPEQRIPGGSRDADKRTDIYQLGKTLYQFLTGLDPILMDVNKVPSGLQHVIRRATRELPDERYSSVGQLIDAIKAYQRAKDPDANPTNTFEATLNRINERLERKEYREKDIHQIFSLLALKNVLNDNDQYMEFFDRIPLEILEIMADVYHEEFQPILRAYVTALDNNVTARGFSYAETVARKMRCILRATNASSELKAFAIEAVLISAVRLNRFAAMDSFNEMLPKIKNNEDAAAVREALERRRDEYSALCEAVPSLKLHPTIRSLRDEIAKEKER